MRDSIDKIAENEAEHNIDYDNMALYLTLDELNELLDAEYKTSKGCIEDCMM